MNRRDLASSLVWLGLSIFVCGFSVDLSVGSFHSPGSGFLSFWSSAVLGVLSIALFIKQFIRTENEKFIADLWKGVSWTKPLLATIFLLIYIVLFRELGYLITTLGLMFFLFWLGRLRLWICLVGAFLTVLCSYLLFDVVLKVGFPKGILGM